MTVSRLLTDNKLEQAKSGLWLLPGTDIDSDFAYSDGDEEESYVMQVIANAEDTSSTSAELESHIRDWPSEYHLTSKRANLLRALDLSGLENVLELGCGCGAISRYLAEQGMQVDAIEGSHRRASIAYSRCRDLDNISIVNSNFNHLILPDKAYDAVFLIGVLEYARRFCPNAVDDRAAVLEIITAVQSSLKTNGVIITAIENRLGLKYLMGASEDHYGVPYIGIHHYPDSAGIRTYDYREWQGILTEAGFNDNTFLTPFPDYKIPSVVLHEKFIDGTEAASHLRGMVSRDYLHALASDFDEYLFWQACVQNGSLLQFTNSYLIIAGREEGSSEEIAINDFAHFTGAQRKPAFRTYTSKRQNEAMVHKRKLIRAETELTGDYGIRQLCEDEAYLQGQLLADIWLQSLMIWADQQRLLKLFRRYYEYLKDYAASNPEANDMIDILPFNIIVDKTGRYKSFDREWLMTKVVSPEFVLFRALFWFVYGNSRQFSSMFEGNGWRSIRDYIEDSFNHLNIKLEDNLDKYAIQEDELQAAIGLDEEQGVVLSLLDTLPQAGSGETMFYPRLYWAQPDELFSEQSSKLVTAVMGDDRQCIAYDVAVELAAGSLLRFDPAERDGYFHLHRVKLKVCLSENNTEATLLNLSSAEDINTSLASRGTSLCGAGENAVFVAHDRDPHFIYKIPDSISSFTLQIELDWPHSEEYEVVREGLREHHGEWAAEKKLLQKQVDELEFNLLQVNTHRDQQKQIIEQKNIHLQHVENELLAIKQSRSYRLARKASRIIKR
ncbi:MAG: class I SAM-dependent methyltransferase [Arenicellales bacterium]